MYRLSSLVLLALSGLSSAYVGPGVVTGDTSVHDPTICKDDSGKYFVFSTGTGLEIRTSTDRTAWTYEGLVWPDGASWTDEYTDTSNGSVRSSQLFPPFLHLFMYLFHIGFCGHLTVHIRMDSST